MTPHENMIMTVQLLAKRKTEKIKREKKAEYEVKSYISSSILKARVGSQKRPTF